MTIYINPLWAGFVCGIITTILFIMVLAVVFKKGKGDKP
jgi:ABC-type uncharacterized transport system permease subunit